MRHACNLPVLAKLTPNVTSVVDVARAAEVGGADAVSLINTCLGMAVSWRKRRPILGNILGGLSGAGHQADRGCESSIKWQKTVKIPIVGIGGIATIDDVMEFLVVGASAVQIGTANFLQSRGDHADTRCASRRVGGTWSDVGGGSRGEH